MTSKPLDELLQHELTRKQFLQYLGAVALTLAGASTLKQALLDPHHNATQNRPEPQAPLRLRSPLGYSSGSYGGRE